MKTKLFSLLIFFSFSATLAFSQGTVASKTSFAVLGGVNMQNLNGKNLQMPIAPEFYFQPGLMFATKGAKNTTGAIESTYKLSYVELPLNLVYKAVVGNGYFMLGFGPYLAYGIGGKAIYEGGAGTIESDIEFKSSIDSGDPLTTVYVKPFDAGANLFFGYELPAGIFLQLNTQLGLLDINPKDDRVTDNKSLLKNTGYGISLGYRF